MNQTIYSKGLLRVATRSEIRSNAVETVASWFRTLRRIVTEKSGFLFMILSIALFAACGGGSSGGNNCPNCGAPVPNTASGTVQFNGAPLAGATVTVLNNNSNPSTVFAITTTDANGNYSVTGLPTGWNATPNFSFVATKTGYSFNPFMAANPSGNRASYLWDPAPQNWYVNTGANVTRAGFKVHLPTRMAVPVLCLTFLTIIR